MIKSFKEYNEAIEYKGYMLSSYGREAWLEVYNFLLGEGYTDAEVNWILKSKNMRWANDFYGKTDLEGFMSYYEKWKSQIDSGLNSEFR